MPDPEDAHRDLNREMADQPVQSFDEALEQKKQDEIKIKDDLDKGQKEDIDNNKREIDKGAHDNTGKEASDKEGDTGKEASDKEGDTGKEATDKEGDTGKEATDKEGEKLGELEKEPDTGDESTWDPEFEAPSKPQQERGREKPGDDLL